MNDLQMTNQDLSQRQSMEELANQLTLATFCTGGAYGFGCGSTGCRYASAGSG